MKHDEAIILAAKWYRDHYDVRGPVDVRSVRDDESNGYYCEIDSADDTFGVLVYDDGTVSLVGQDIEYIKVRRVP